jgi:hypothetical protein
MAFIRNGKKEKLMANSSAPRAFDTLGALQAAAPSGSTFSTESPERIRPRSYGAHKVREGRIMSRNTYVAVAAAVAFGLVASGCSSPTNSAAKTSPASAAQLQSLIPTPVHTQRTDGPNTMPDNGINLHFLVNGSSTGVMDAYKTALQGKGWTVTVVASGGWTGAGGATYTATQGDAYGVFTGGGNEATADVHACAWPSKPANPNCGSGGN